MHRCKRLSCAIGLLCLLIAVQTPAGETKVAVASNFTNAVKAITKQFEAETGHSVTLAFGSTGKHYAQIKNGAPFSAFLAADVRRPHLLEDEGLAVEGTRFTYAVGRIVLWSPDENLVDAKGDVLESNAFTHLAIANPKLAPYGEASRQVMQALGVWEALQDRIVRGENIGQTYQFIKSGNAQLGFVAFAQLIGADGPAPGSLWEPSQELYDPIAQQAVLLREDPVAQEFLDYLQGETAHKIIADYGYGAP